MVQKAHQYTERNDWNDPVMSGNQDSSKWVWAALAALAIAAGVIFMATSGPSTSPVGTPQTLTSEPAPPPAQAAPEATPAPAEQPIVPAEPPPVAPAQPQQ